MHLLSDFFIIQNAFNLLKKNKSDVLYLIGYFSPIMQPPRAAWIFMKCVFIQRWRLSDLRRLLIRLSASPSGYHAHIWSGCDLLRWLNGLDDLMGNIHCCKSNWPPAWRYGIVGALGCGEGRVLLQSERRMRISPVLPLYLRSAATATARLFLHY